MFFLFKKYFKSSLDSYSGNIITVSELGFFIPLDDLKQGHKTSFLSSPPSL